MTPKPVSKAAQIRAAERMLRGLLKTPKTRAGLIAAVTKGVVSRNYVYGWLAEGSRDGTLTKLRSMGACWYQLTPEVIEEVPLPGIFPGWLDPRSLPASRSRTVVVDGVVIKTKTLTQKKNKK